MADNIYKFPGAARKPVAAPVTAKPKPKHEAKPARPALHKSILGSLWRGIWIATVLVWPFLKWVVSIDVFFRLVLAVYHWDTPSSYAGWTLLGHFIVLVGLTWYVSAYKPKGL